MSPIEELVENVGSRLALGPEARSLVQGLLQLIFSDSEGLKGFLDRFKAAGLGDLASSWIGKSDNPPLGPQGAAQAFGGQAIAELAQKAGLDAGVTTAALAYVAPKLVGLLTSGGAIPISAPTAISAFLSGVPGGAAPAAAAPAPTAPAPTPVRAANTGMFRRAETAERPDRRGEDTAGVNRYIFPAVAALLAAAFIYHFWVSRTERAAPAPPVAPAAPSPDGATPAPRQ